MLDLRHPPHLPLVAPSLLAADFGAAAEDAADALAAGGDLLHLDVMDGHFVPNLTMGADMIKGIRRRLPEAYLDVHLMVERPHDYVTAFAEAGANSFTFHAEICEPHRVHGVDAPELIAAIRAAGMQPGMVINPPTPVDWVQPHLAELDLVLVMSVFPGAGGQSFMPSVLEKCRALRERMPSTARLEIDGGISSATAAQARAAGVDLLVSGSAVFGAPDRAAEIAAIRGEATPKN